MANREKGQVSFNAKGKRWILRYSTNAICELEGETNQSAMQVAQELNDPATAKLRSFRAMLWAGLTDEQPDITIREAGDLIQEAGLETLAPLIGEAFQLAFPDADADPAEEQSKPGKRKAA